MVLTPQASCTRALYVSCPVDLQVRFQHDARRPTAEPVLAQRHLARVSFAELDRRGLSAALLVQVLRDNRLVAGHCTCLVMLDAALEYGQSLARIVAMALVLEHRLGLDCLLVRNTVAVASLQALGSG